MLLWADCWLFKLMTVLTLDMVLIVNTSICVNLYDVLYRSPHEMSHLRLAAGASMLKICEQKGVGDQFTAEQFINLSRLINVSWNCNFRNELLNGSEYYVFWLFFITFLIQRFVLLLPISCIYIYRNETFSNSLSIEWHVIVSCIVWKEMQPCLVFSWNILLYNLHMYLCRSYCISMWLFLFSCL